MSANTGATYAVQAGFWVESAPSQCNGDANGDSVVNFNDITSVLSNWLNVCP